MTVIVCNRNIISAFLHQTASAAPFWGKLHSVSAVGSAATRAVVLPSFPPSKTYTFTYNAHGQRVGSHYSYDPGTGTPSSIATGEVTESSKAFTYDNLGRLVTETTTETLYGTGSATSEIVFLYDQNTIIGMRYTSSLNGTNTYYFRRNLQGDVIEIYDTAGNRKVKYNYDAWGNCTIASQTTDAVLARVNPIRYRGYYYDTGTGLYYLNARYYNPQWRRFISPDSTEYVDPEAVNGLNRYAYCNNDPVNYADPSGHSVTLILLGAFIFGGAIGAATSFTTQLVQNKTVNWGLVLSDAIFGGIDGLLAASGFGILTSAFLGASLNMLQTAASSAILGENITTVDVFTSLVLGAGGAFIPNAGINAKQISGKWSTFARQINNAVSTQRKLLYKARRRELMKHTLFNGANYAGSTIGSSVISDKISQQVRWYYGC